MVWLPELFVVYGIVVNNVMVQESKATSHVPVSYCEAEVFHASCGENEVIVIMHAQYGRMRLGRCVTSDYGFVGCADDVIAILDKVCSGKRHCEVRIPNKDLDKAHTCPKDFKTYLEVDFKCVRVHLARCEPLCDNITILTDQSGFLSTFPLADDACAALQCPLRIEVEAGQRINITLIDFNHGVNAKFPLIRQGVRHSDICKRYASIEDDGKVSLVCSGRQRRRHVILSSSHTLDINLFATETNRGPALLQYEVVGCANLKAPAHSTVTRDGDQLTVSCASSKTTHHLHCDGARWMGSDELCPTIYTSADQNGQSDSIPLGLLIAVIVGIAVVICACVLTAGVVIIKRKRMAHSRHAAENTYNEYCRRAILREQQYSGSSAKSTPNAYDYTMELRPLPSIPHSSCADAARCCVHAPRGREAAVDERCDCARAHTHSGPVITTYGVPREQRERSARIYEKMRENRREFGHTANQLHWSDSSEQSVDAKLRETYR